MINDWFVGIKNKIQGTGSTIKEQLSHMKKDTVWQKELLESNKVVYLKTDSIAVLVRKKGNEVKFFEELDSITKEGYKMMLQEQVSDPIPFVKVDLTRIRIYYFQNIKYISWWLEVLGYGISLILLNVGMYVGIPAIVIVGIKKRFYFLLIILVPDRHEFMN